MMPDCLKNTDLLCMLREDPARNGLACAAYLDAAAIVDAARGMLTGGYHLEDIAVLHAAEGYLLSYFFAHAGAAPADSAARARAPGRVCLRLLVPEEAPSVPSISSVYQGADWHEREADDFYGICFEGHPNPVRLFLPSDMDIYPLRKEEAARAPVRTLLPFAPEAVVMKKETFTLFDPEPDPAQGGDEPLADGANAESDKD